MRDATQRGTPPANRYNVPVFNSTAEQIPAFGAMQIVGSSNFGSDTIYTVGKPNGAAGAKFLLNSPVPIPAGIPGAGTDQYPTDALISGTAPTFNQEIGPVAGSWGLTISGKGFMYLGGLASGIGRVASKGATSSPGDDFPLVKIVNTTGLTKPFGSIVGYGVPVDPPPTTLHRIPTFVSAPPQAGQPFCVLLAEALNSQTVDAGPIGVVPVQINYTDTSHGFAEAINNDYAKLASASNGPARIIWRERQGIAGGGTLGLQWARVLLDWTQAEDIRAIAYSTIAAATGTPPGNLTPGTGMAKLYNMPTGDPGTAWTPSSGDPVQVENWSDSSIATDTRILLRPSRRLANGAMLYVVIPRGGGGGITIYTGTGTVSAGSASNPIPGQATIYQVNNDGTTTIVPGGQKTVYNPFQHFTNQSFTCVPLGDDKYFITAVFPTSCATKQVVVDVACITNEQGQKQIKVTKDTIQYLDQPCP